MSERGGRCKGREGGAMRIEPGLKRGERRRLGSMPALPRNCALFGILAMAVITGTARAQQTPQPQRITLKEA